ncbi:CHAT domain-containing protein [Streptomyces sp. NPDC002328]|uniref:CHAT domain-containing protein n=1 Tax=Streptomyces sp. NPDC002328 TaxID=3364642 RepID=UPI0036AE5368
MAAWWKALGLRALLEANAETLAAVWPAVRDGTAPPVPDRRRTKSLAALCRVASKAAAAGGDDAPELAVGLLAGVVLHRVVPVARPPALLPLFDLTADVDAESAAAAAGAAAGFAARAGSDRTPQWLRRWCLDAALLCGSRCLHGPAPDEDARGQVHHHLALLAGQRFEAVGDPADEDIAFTHARAALDLATGPERPDRAARLARLLTGRSVRLRDPSLMEDGVELARSALALRDPGSLAWLAQATATVGTLLAATAKDTENVDLLDEALDVERAMRRHPQYHRLRDMFGDGYAGLLAQRFARRRDRGILDEAIAAYEELYALEPGRYAADLGRHLQYRFQTHGDTAELRRAVDLMAEGLSAAPAGQEAIMSYGTAVLQEHRATGGTDAVDRAVATVTRLTAPGAAHADDSQVLGTLSDLLRATGERARPPEYGPAEAAARRSLTRAGTAGHRARALARLAEVLVDRYRATRDLALLDEAVACCREGAAVLPPGADVPPQLPGALVMALVERHARTRHLASLREAVDAAERLVDETPDFGSERPVILGNLVALIVEHAQRTGDPAELDRGQRLVEHALATTAPGHHGRGHLLVALGGILLARTRLPGAGIEAADTAVRHCEAALRDVPENPRGSAPVLYGNLAHALWARHDHGGGRADLDRALEAARTAVRMLPPGEPRRGNALTVLSRMLTTTARTDGDHDAVRDEVFAVNAELAADPGQSALVRTGAALELATLAGASGDMERALSAARAAMETLPLLAWRGVDRSDQEEMLGHRAQAGTFAGLIALAVQRPAEALELLEAGRGVLAAQALELRTETDELSDAQPELAARLDALRHSLDRVAVDGTAGEEADRRHRLAREWQETLDEIRAHDGFQDFLRPPRAEQLLRVAEHGPVVVVTGGPRSGGYALLLDGPDVQALSLPGFSEEEARERGETLARAAAAAARSGLARAFAEQAVGDILDWLWRTVAGPVLDALGVTGPPAPGQDPPRLWWCPSGALSFLPLHAAGEVPDRVVSSYTPSVAALLRARGGTAAGAHPLIVAVPELDGQAPLPGALREAGLAHAAVGGTLLTGDAARTDTVRTALTAHSWAHFACHGVQDPEQPSRGRLLLSDGELSVRDVSRFHLPGAQFAYLSACETAVGGTRLPDEALHLAGTLQLAGFSQVIGTLWRVDDESSAEIAQGVYGVLKDAGPGAPPAALALHRAVGRLRARHPDRPLSWAAHLHSGA